LRGKKENPKVSVVIPTYNRAAKVQSTIESVLAQTVTDIEVIVVDDGSSDDTGRVLDEVFGDHIRYYAQTNQGVSAARNKGISEARGEWIAFLDSDDLWEPEKLELQLKALGEFSAQCGACYTDVRLMNHPETRSLFQMAEHVCRHEDAMGINGNVLEVLVRPGGGGMVVCISSVVARADAVRTTGGFDPTLGFYADSEFMFRLAMLTGFCYVNRVLVRFDRSPAETRHVGASKEWDKLEFMLRESQIRLEKFLGIGESVPVKIRKLIREHLGSVHSGLANCHLENGEYGKARESLSRAAQLDLTFNIAVKWFLTRLSPRLAIRTVRHHQERRKDSVPVI
jgi:glycosyltransferase involved in cell wall biosynthesis